MLMKTETTITAAVIAVAVIAWCGVVQAESYTYMCKVPSEHKSYPVKIDVPGGVFAATETKRVDQATIKWRGTTFRNLKLIDGCRYNFQATHLDNTIEVCTATHGYAELTLGDDSFECLMKGTK
jgi:hypothetical protein